MRPDTWYPSPGMRFDVPETDDEPAEVFEVRDLNNLCKCGDCPCYFGAIGKWAGQFSAADLRTLPFTDDNTVTEPGPQPSKTRSGYHTLEPVSEQGVLL